MGRGGPGRRRLPPRTGGLITLDGSHGEGGGQIVRAALALAAALGRPVALERIRAGRPKPGLQPQHLAVVRALAAVSGAQVAGDALGSTALSFVPHGLRGGEYRFDVAAVQASAGSVTLLFEALLLPLSFAPAASRVLLLGGTHVPWSPPAHYVAEVLLPALARAGLTADLVLRRWGWYPAGGGEAEGRIAPGPARRGLRLVGDEPEGPVQGLAAVSRLPRSIAERLHRRAQDRLTAAGVAATIRVEEDATARGPGALLFLALPGRAGFTALGRRGVPAERVADEAVDALLAFQTAGAGVDDRLADQLLPFLALAGERSEVTCPGLSSHLRTVAWVVERLLPARVELDPGPPARVRVDPGGSG